MLRKVKKIRLGAWFGMLALAVQFYLPVHLVHMVESGSRADIEATGLGAHHHHSVEHVVNASAEAHHASLPDGQPIKGHSDCPICSMLHASAAFALPTDIELEHPTLAGLGSTSVLHSFELASASAASYASRAPPSSIG
jgi:hypothetical protein